MRSTAAGNAGDNRHQTIGCRFTWLQLKATMAEVSPSELRLLLLDLMIIEPSHSIPARRIPRRVYSSH